MSHIIAGKPADFEIKIVNSAGEPVVADREFRLRVSTVGASADKDLILIPKGQSQTHINIRRDSPGVSYVSVTPLEASSVRPATDVPVAFSAEPDYKPVPPLTLILNVSQSKLRAGIDKVKVSGLIEDKARVPVPAQHDYDISFPGLSDLITPYPMHIKTGSSGGECTLASPTPGILPFTPAVNPPLTIVSNASTVEFDSPILGLRILADPSYINAVTRRSTQVKVGFFDVHKNWIGPDDDRTVILNVEPPDAGTLGISAVTIPKGIAVYETKFTPLKEGVAKITALTEPGLIVDTAQIEFHYAFSLFLIIAALGGIAGGVVRHLVQGGKQDFKSIVLAGGLGTLLGLLAYILAPALVSVSFKPESLQNASKLFEAFLWGFIGGGSGAALFAKLLPTASQPPAARLAPPAPSNSPPPAPQRSP